MTISVLTRQTFPMIFLRTNLLRKVARALLYIMVSVASSTGNSVPSYMCGHSFFPSQRVRAMFLPSGRGRKGTFPPKRLVQPWELFDSERKSAHTYKKTQAVEHIGGRGSSQSTIVYCLRVPLKLLSRI